MPVARTGGNRALSGDFAAALIAPLVALVAAEIIHSGWGLTRLGLLFLAAVTVAASVRGQRAAVFTALVSVIAYRAFLDLRTSDHTTPVEDALNLAIFLVVALITGALAGRVYDEAAKARRHADSMELLFKTSRTLSEEEQNGFWPTLTEAVSRSSGGSVVAIDHAGQIRAQSAGATPHPATLDFGWTLVQSSGEPHFGPPAGWRARTIPSEAPHAGVLLWETKDVANGSEELIELLIDLGSASLARARVRDEQVRIQAAQEAEKLREALLSSISHDFRSPLAAIIGSSTSLLEYGERFDERVRRDLLLNIRDEGERLNQFIVNLLNMTKLQAGVVQASKQLVKADDVIGSALERLERHRGELPKVDRDANCVVEADPLLLEQAIYNVLDNAFKYAASSKGIQITCSNGSARSEILIADHGPGLAEEDLDGVFKTFHFSRKNGPAKGTGLGLSIARGFVEAMGGTIQARARSDGQTGLEVAITLPRCDA